MCLCLTSMLFASEVFAVKENRLETKTQLLPAEQFPGEEIGIDPVFNFQGNAK